MSESQPPRKLSQADAQEIIRLANIIYFRTQAYENTHWMGVKAMKCPMDMWIYQELMFALKTDLVIETGTFAGGSALFFANVLDALGAGSVLSIDINLQARLPQHERIEYLEGSSVSPAVLETVAARCEGAESVLVILDSDHKAAYKLQELRAYAGFVTPDSYLIAEDSTFDYFPAWPEYGPGPASAVREFMNGQQDFEMDRSQERHLVTFAPAAFLRRKSPADD